MSNTFNMKMKSKPKPRRDACRKLYRVTGRKQSINNFL